MSRRISNEENEQRFSVRAKRFISGEQRKYREEEEIRVPLEYVPDEEKNKKNKEDMENMLSKAYDLDENRSLRFFRHFYRIAALLCCIMLVAILLIEVSYLPPVGSANKPTNNEVTQKYIEDGLTDTGGINIVGGMILNYRAFDTFGETNVLYIATCCVMILLLVEDKPMRKLLKMDDRSFEPKSDIILQKIAMFLVPIVFMFGLYVMFNGHLGPGGGFAGGSMIGAGLILYVSAYGTKKTQRFFNEKIYTIIKVASLCIYGVLMIYFFYTGANGLDNHIPLGTPGHIFSAGLILPINILVGLEVACTMYAFYALFRRGDI
ncbi:MAG: MnhB domain-containing protein [Eubacteriales bacterium]|nr:MnhB domain-containing protein [Eubacteriales bacterium]